MLFKLLDGIHSEADNNGGTRRTYRAGEVIETDLDLDRMHNQRDPRTGNYATPPKFERLDNKPAPADDPYRFDPAKETIQQFTERMQKLHTPVQANPPTSTSVQAHGQQNPQGQSAKPHRQPANLAAMSEHELRKLAETEEVTIPADAKGKDAVIKILRAANL